MTSLPPGYTLDRPLAATGLAPPEGYTLDAPSGKGDRLPMAPGAVPHAMPADTVQGGPTPEPASVGSEIGDSIASRYQAGLLDIPGAGGDLVGLANDAADALARPIVKGIRWLAGKPQLTPEQEAAVKQQVDARAGAPLGFLPTSGDIKKAVGFQAFQPQTAAGKTFDKWGGGAVELIPSLLTGSGEANLIKTALTQGVKTAAKKAPGQIVKYAVAPSVASEAAGELTKGTAFEPWARLVAAVATGGVAGAKRGKMTGAPSVEEWRATGDKAFADMRAAGVGIKPSSYDRMVNDAEQALHKGDYLPGLHPEMKVVLDHMKAAQGIPKSFDELVQYNRLASRQLGNIDKDKARVAGILADHIDNFMENLKPGDLMAGSNPKAAFEAWKTGKDAWRKMRAGERIASIFEGSLDTQGANYSSAGQQTALRQAFKRFKWRGGVGKEHSREFKSLPPEGQSIVNSLIRGVSTENALRIAGKFNLKNPLVHLLLTGLGVTLNPGALAVGGLATLGSGARALSARSTIAGATRLGDLVRGGQWAPGRLGRPPNAIFYGTAAERSSDQSK